MPGWARPTDRYRPVRNTIYPVHTYPFGHGIFRLFSTMKYNSFPSAEMVGLASEYCVLTRCRQVFYCLLSKGCRGGYQQEEIDTCFSSSLRGRFRLPKLTFYRTLFQRVVLRPYVNTIETSARLAL